MNTIADYALGLILDDTQCAEYIDQIATKILGRGPGDDIDEDEEWWKSKSQAIGELINQIRLANTGRGI